MLSDLDQYILNPLNDPRNPQNWDDKEDEEEEEESDFFEEEYYEDDLIQE